MISSAANEYDCHEDDCDTFEKFSQSRDGRMPVGRANAAKRAAYRSAPSRRASHRNSRRNGGIHHRRHSPRASVGARARRFR